MASILLLLSVSSIAYAYSYAAAGKEPLIDGRETILQALSVGDYKVVALTVNDLKEEFDYLLSDHNVDLRTPMMIAVKEKNARVVENIVDQAVVEEIIRRLDGANDHLTDYQVAKVLVVKSKLFLDLISAKLDDENRNMANLAIQGVLESIGNPGVFGVGQAPADPEMFTLEKNKLLSAIEGLKHY